MPEHRYSLSDSIVRKLAKLAQTPEHKQLVRRLEVGVGTQADAVEARRLFIEAGDSISASIVGGTIVWQPGIEADVQARIARAAKPKSWP